MYDLFINNGKQQTEVISQESDALPVIIIISFFDKILHSDLHHDLALIVTNVRYLNKIKQLLCIIIDKRYCWRDIAIVTSLVRRN